MTRTLKQAERRVVRTAMEWFKHITSGDVPFNEPRDKLLAACAALSKQSKPRQRKSSAKATCSPYDANGLKEYPGE